MQALCKSLCTTIYSAGKFIGIKGNRTGTIYNLRNTQFALVALCDEGKEL